MPTSPHVPSLKVVFLTDWKTRRAKSFKGEWIVLKHTNQPQARWLATYANLTGKGDLLRTVSESDLQTIIAGIEEGFSTEAVDRVTDLLGVNRSDLSTILAISPRTLSRRQKLKPTASERLFRVSALFQRALEVLGGRDEARRWFMTSKLALGGKTPFEFSETEVGAREVEDLLGRIEYGVYS